MRPAPSRDTGSATLEAALALPSLLLLALALCGVLVGMSTQIRCVDAARLGARAAARGEPETAVRAAIAQALPKGNVRIADADGFVHVSVTSPVAGLPLLRSFVVRAEAAEADEDATP